MKAVRQAELFVVWCMYLCVELDFSVLSIPPCLVCWPQVSSQMFSLFAACLRGLVVA